MGKKIFLNMQIPKNVPEWNVVGYNNSVAHHRSIVVGSNASSQETGDIIFDTTETKYDEPTLRITEEGHIYIRGKRITKTSDGEFQREFKNILIEAFQMGS